MRKKKMKPASEAKGDKCLVYLDFSVEKEGVGRVIIDLNKKAVPKSAENFRALCTGENGVGTFGKPLHYKGSIVHKAIPQFMIQCGDITNFDGSGGESVYGPFFEDENFTLQHDDEGIVGMANTGERDSNNSQFYISTVPCPHLDGQNVVIGRVLHGFDVIREISETETVNDRPITRYEISDCGEVKDEDDLGLREKDGTADTYPPWPKDWHDCYSHSDNITHEMMTEIAVNIKNSGNVFYNQNRYSLAERKYKKAIAYVNWYIEFLDKIEKPDKKFGQDIRITCLLNLAAVKLQTKSYKEAISLSNEVLKLHPENVKAMYRKAQANIGLNNHEVGLECLRNANKLIPCDKSIVMEMNKVKRSIRQYLAVEKETFSRMFNKF